MVEKRRVSAIIERDGLRLVVIREHGARSGGREHDAASINVIHDLLRDRRSKKPLRLCRYGYF